MSLSPSYQRLQLGEEAKKAAGLIAWFLVVGIVSAHAQDPGTLNPEPLPPLPIQLAGSTSEGIVRPQNNAAAWATAIDWLICRRLSCGRCRAANQGTNLAGDAGVTRSLLGQSESGGIY